MVHVNVLYPNIRWLCSQWSVMWWSGGLSDCPCVRYVSYLLLDVMWFLVVSACSLWLQSPSTRLINTKMRTESTITMKNVRTSFIVSLGQLEPPLCLFCPRQHTFKWPRLLYWLASYSGNVAVTHFAQPELLTTKSTEPCHVYSKIQICVSMQKSKLVFLVRLH